MRQMLRELLQSLDSLPRRERRRIVAVLVAGLFVIALMLLLRPLSPQPGAPGSLLIAVEGDVVWPLVQLLPAAASDTEFESSRLSWKPALATSGVASSLDPAPRPQARPTRAPRPSPSVVPSPLPSPSPEEEEELTLQLPDLTEEPAPPVSAKPSAGPPLRGTSALSGKLLHTVANNRVEPIPNHAVFLVRLGTMDSSTVNTDGNGNFKFTGLVPGGVYYVVAMHEYVYQEGTRYDIDYRGYNGAQPVPVEVPNLVTRSVSWHQAVYMPDRAGTFSIELSNTNSDADYCDDVMPTNDPVSRTPYRSWRQAELIPIAAGPG